jgi:hypothetical protein
MQTRQLGRTGLEVSRPGSINLGQAGDLSSDRRALIALHLPLDSPATNV